MIPTIQYDSTGMIMNSCYKSCVVKKLFVTYDFKLLIIKIRLMKQLIKWTRS